MTRVVTGAYNTSSLVHTVLSIGRQKYHLPVKQDQFPCKRPRDTSSVRWFKTQK